MPSRSVSNRAFADEGRLQVDYLFNVVEDAVTCDVATWAFFQADGSQRLVTVVEGYASRARCREAVAPGGERTYSDRLFRLGRRSFKLVTASPEDSCVLARPGPVPPPNLVVSAPATATPEELVCAANRMVFDGPWASRMAALVAAVDVAGDPFERHVVSVRGLASRRGATLFTPVLDLLGRDPAFGSVVCDPAAHEPPRLAWQRRPPRTADQLDVVCSTPVALWLAEFWPPVRPREGTGAVPGVTDFGCLPGVTVDDVVTAHRLRGAADLESPLRHFASALATALDLRR